MSIEETLTRLADAQERTATALEGVLAALLAGAATSVTVTPTVTIEGEASEKPASRGSTRQRNNVEREDKPAPQPEPEPEPDPLDDPLDAPAKEPEEKFSEEDVRKALKSWRDINGSDALTALLKRYGASGMASLKPADYPAIMKEVC